MPPLRPGTLDDAAAIARVKIVGWRSTYSEWIETELLEEMLEPGRVQAWIERQLAAPSTICVLAAADEVLGFGIVTQAEGEAELDSLHVLPRWRGRGLGRSLVTALAQRLSESGRSTMRVTVVKENDRARGFYERLGARYEDLWPAPWAAQHAIEEAVYRWTDLGELLARAEARGESPQPIR